MGKYNIAKLFLARTVQLCRRSTSSSSLMSEPFAKKRKSMPESIADSIVEQVINGVGNGGACKDARNGAAPSSIGKTSTENGSKLKNGDGGEGNTDGSVLYIKKLSEDAFTPVRGSDNAAGFDLHSACDKLIPAHGKELVSTKLAITVPKGSYGRIAPRSGLACKNFIDVGAGVIDRDYTGEVKVLLFNFSEKDFEVKKGNRIAQLVIEKIFMPKLIEVEDLEETKRGDTGFGASGK